MFKETKEIYNIIEGEKKKDSIKTNRFIRVSD